MNGQKAKWTSAQEEAISAPAGNLLVSAAAGAGKTAVLVERVIRRVLDPKDPVDIDRLLLVTFTEAAAAEMRQRIGAALGAALASAPGNNHLERQLALLGRASISTLHSFCLRVVRRYFYQLELDPAFRVMDEAEADLLAHEVLDSLWEERYEAEVETNGPFIQLLDCYGNARSDDDLKELVLTIHNFSRSQPWPEEWLRKTAASFHDADAADEATLPWVRPLLAVSLQELGSALLLLARAAELAGLPAGPAQYLSNIQQEQEAVAAAVRTARYGSWDDLRASLEIAFEPLPRVHKTDDVDPELKEQVQDLRDRAKKIVRQLREGVYGRPLADLVADLTSMAPIVTALCDLVLEFSRRFQAAKRARARVDFSDLEHYALSLLRDNDLPGGVLKPSPLAQELAQEYAEVLVDEYQDINPVQDAILTLVSGQDGPSPRLFLVGDVKQSIYRFRLAEPRLFLQKYRDYPSAPGGRQRRLSLKHNFRSRSEVITAVNFIFRQILTREVGDLDYDAEAELVPGAAYAEPPAGARLAGGPVELHLVERSAKENQGRAALVEAHEQQEEEAAHEPVDLGAVEKEALLIGRRIREMVQGAPTRPGPEFMVWDKAAGSYRPVTYRDIVVLLRTMQGRANTMLEVLRQLEIPAYAELGSGYFTAPEVGTMLSLLKIIDNPRQDIPLAAVLRSPLVGLSPEELAQVRLAAPGADFHGAVWAASSREDFTGRKKLQLFLAQLQEWRTAARRGTLADLIWRIYRETGYLSYVGALPAGAQRQANLRALYDRARQFESFGRPGLFRFLRFLERFQAEEGDLGTARALGENENVVRIMSIHKSKGLEFPVVFVADLGKKFNLDDLKGDILLHRDLGLGPVVVNTGLGIKYPSLAHHAIKAASRQEILAEELRILYVALTRARERLILVGSASELTKQRQRWTQAACAEGWRLPTGTLASASSYLDWLCPALVRHAQGTPLREGNLWVRPDPAVAADPASFQIFLYGPEDMVPLKQAVCQTGAECNQGEIASQVEPELLAEVKRRLSWRYPNQTASKLAAKLSVSELKRRALLGRAQEEEEEPGKGWQPLGWTRQPRFAQAEEGLAGAERGSAVHLVLEHLDLRRELSASGIAIQVQELVEREFLTPEQAASVDSFALAEFFASPLGRRLTLDPGAVRRELPFSLCLPARQVYLNQDLTPSEAEELVLLQGIIDCLVALPDGWLLLDFKTDQIGPAGLTERLPGYLRQVEIYAQAVCQLTQRPVVEAYLYFLVLKQAIPVRLLTKESSLLP
jgi:ATP-dependent helicase/nuclease subunit A